MHCWNVGARHRVHGYVHLRDFLHFAFRTEKLRRSRVFCASRRWVKASSSAEWGREGGLARREATVPWVG